MAESEPVTRARALTNVDSGIISTSDMSTLEATAKDEIGAELSESDIDFTDADKKSALFWLLCLFIKINIGDLGADGYSIGEIETKNLTSEDKIWLDNHRRAMERATGGNIIRHSKASRDGRQYGSDKGSEGAPFGDS